MKNELVHRIVIQQNGDKSPPLSVEETVKETRPLCSDACKEINMLCCAPEMKCFQFVTEAPGLPVSEMLPICLSEAAFWIS